MKIWENTDQKNSEYGHFSRKVTINTLMHKVLETMQQTLETMQQILKDF